MSLSEPGIHSEGFAAELLAIEGGLVVALSGEFDLTGVDRFRDALDAALSADRAEIAFDFTRLRFIDSSGIAQLIIAINQLATTGRRLCACGVGGQVETVLTLAGVLQRVHLMDCPPDAIAWPD